MDSIYPDLDPINFSYASRQSPAPPEAIANVPPLHEGFVPHERLASPAPATGEKRKRGPGRPRIVKGEKGRGNWGRGRKKARVEPNEEFGEVYNEALSAFIDEDYEAALDLCSEAIAVNPEVWTAHALLAQILEAQGEEEKSIQALYNGCFAAKTTEAWLTTAEAYMHTKSVDRAYALQQALSCYTEALRSNREVVELNFKRALIHRELRANGRALGVLNQILEKQPHNPSVLRLIAEICIDSNEIEPAKKHYEAFLEHSKGPLDPGDDRFDWSDANVYVELFAHDDDYTAAISKLKSIGRWLLGRGDETYWDDVVDDDREWDAHDGPRRITVPQYRPNVYAAECYGDGMPLELRVKLGIYRLRQGPDFKAEALLHFEWLEPDDEESDAKVNDYADLFLEVARSLISSREHEQALRFLLPLRSIQAINDVKGWLAIAECYYVTEDRDEAIECYENAAESDHSCAEARTQLSKLYAAAGKRVDAVRYGREAVDLRMQEIPTSGKRRYQRKDQRLLREEAEKALRAAKRMKEPKPQRAVRLPKPPQYPKAVKTVQVQPQKVPEPNEFRFLQDKAATKLAGMRLPASQTQWQLDWDPPPDELLLSAPKPQPRKFVRKLRVPTKKESEEERELKTTERVAAAFQNLREYTEPMRAGDNSARIKWMQEADSMITEFRTNRSLYPYDRHVQLDQFRTETLKKRFDKTLPVFTDRREQLGGSSEREGSSEINTEAPSDPSMPTTYRNIPLRTWLDIFLELALLQAKGKDRDDCYVTLTSATDCTIWYQDPNAMLTIYTVYFVCALILRDGTTLFNTACRWFMRRFQFCTDAYRLFTAMNLFHQYSPIPGGKDAQMNYATFRLGPSQKFLMRQVKTLDALLPTNYNAGGPEGPVPDFMRVFLKSLSREEHEQDSRDGNGSKDGDDEEDGNTPSVTRPPTPQSSSALGPLFSQLHNPDEKHKPTEIDVVLMTLYGHILYAGGSYPNALNYYYRAYAIDPHNSTVLLSMSLSYIHQMFKRQNDNRHLWLLRGMVFFEEYVEARVAWAERCEVYRGRKGVVKSVQHEISFNRARMWQMLGMADLGMREYAKLLDTSKPDPNLDSRLSGSAGTGDTAVYGADQQADDYSKESAYALQVMYAMNGNVDMAKQITEKYLVVE